MDMHKVLTELHRELRGINAAMTVLERLAKTGRRGRGRPPKWLSQMKEKPDQKTSGGLRKSQHSTR